ncbi:9294_t:CDS:2, partial [Entrophospora sp. SA101]
LGTGRDNGGEKRGTRTLQNHPFTIQEQSNHLTHGEPETMINRVTGIDAKHGDMGTWKLCGNQSVDASTSIESKTSNPNSHYKITNKDSLQLDTDHIENFAETYGITAIALKWNEMDGSMKYMGDDLTEDTCELVPAKEYIRRMNEMAAMSWNNRIIIKINKLTYCKLRKVLDIFYVCPEFRDNNIGSDFWLSIFIKNGATV